MGRILDEWTFDLEDNRNQLQPEHQSPLQDDFEGFQQQLGVAVSTPQRRLREVLNRTLLDPSTDDSDNDGSEIRGAVSNDVSFLSFSGGLFRASTADPSSTTTPDSRRDYYFLTASDPLEADLPECADRRAERRGCGPDCWCAVQASPATAGSSPRFSFDETGSSEKWDND